jgi:hypothetical protein
VFELVGWWTLENATSPFCICASFQVGNIAAHVVTRGQCGQRLQYIALWWLISVASSKRVATKVPISVCACEIATVSIVGAVPLVLVEVTTGTLVGTASALLGTALLKRSFDAFCICTLEFCSIVSVEKLRGTIVQLATPFLSATGVIIEG